MIFELHSLDETKELARELGNLLMPGDVVALIGPLGAGKTTFTAGVAEGLVVPKDYRVTSPTFVYAQIYPGRIPLYHMDMYRIEDTKTLNRLGLEEMIGTDGVAMIEWFDLFPSVWMSDRLELRFTFDSSKRTLEVMAFGERPKELMEEWRALHER